MLFTLLLACSSSPIHWGVQGRVLTVTGDPVSDALIVLDGSTTRTRPDGTFLFEELAPSEDELLYIRAPGYSHWQDHIAFDEGAWTYVDATLAPVERVELPDAAAGGQVETSTGLRLRFPAGAVVDSVGSPVSGPVTVSIVHLDEPSEVLAAPGGLELGERGGQMRRERSWGLAELELSQGGRTLQLGEAVTLSMPLAEGWEGEDLRLTWFNPDTDLWEVESEVRVQDGRALAQLEHFSWYGVGRPLDVSGCVQLQLRTEAGKNLPTGSVVLAIGEDALYYGTFILESAGLLRVGLERGTRLSLRLAYGPYTWSMEGVEVPGEDEDCLVVGGRETSPVRDMDLDDDGFPNGADCDDRAPEVHPAALEVWYDGLDQDCDAWSDYDRDQDGDDCAPGWAVGCPGLDCDDGDSNRSSTHAELCDGVDNDCDAELDEDALDAVIWYLDTDSDGFGADGSTLTQCGQPPGYSDQGGDCDDSEACAYPSALSARAADPEDPCMEQAQDVCAGGTDLEDLDCNGFTGAGDVDKDGDGVASCGDCDELDAQVYPGQNEDCNGLDDDCDGEVDEHAGRYWYADADGDGYGDLSRRQMLCVGDTMSGWVSTAGDCDDLNALRSPESEELCDGVDNDCDGEVDEDAVDVSLWFEDVDGDGRGSGVGTPACLQPSGAVSNDGDCYDTPEDFSSTVYPGAEELCGDGRVQDCGMTEAEAMLVCNSGVRDLADADIKFVGEGAGDYAGWSVSGAGDLDGDGLGDLLVGAMYNDEAGSYAGAAYVLLSDGALKDPLARAYKGEAVTLSLDLADIKLLGEEGHTHAGISVSSAGDVDGDGLSDLLVGASGEGSSGTGPGAAYLLLSGGALGDAVREAASGTQIKLQLGEADLRIVGEYAKDHAGRFVSSAGDVDGDGFDDVLLGAHYQDIRGSTSGAAYLLLSDGALGRAVDEALDQGLATLELSDADVKFLGEEADDSAGFSLTGVGDVDGDHTGDILIAAAKQSGGGRYSGASYVLLSQGALGTAVRESLANGPVTVSLSDADIKLVGEEIKDYAGQSQYGAGDVDGDGRADLLVGAYGQDAGGLDSGAAYVLLSSGALGDAVTLAIGAGPTLLDLSEADIKVIGEEEGDWAGFSVSDAGDLDGDGLGDVMLGARYQGTGSKTGAVYVLLSGGALGHGVDEAQFGAPVTLDLAEADLKLVGEETDDMAGGWLSTKGDLNGDGRTDLLLGAPGQDRGGNRADAGAAYLILSRWF